MDHSARVEFLSRDPCAAVLNGNVKTEKMTNISLNTIIKEYLSSVKITLQRKKRFKND